MQGSLQGALFNGHRERIDFELFSGGFFFGHTVLHVES